MNADSTMTFSSIRDQFLATFLRQRFSFPDSLIYYILKNPASSKVYQKLIQSCKYFFIKNPILVVHCLQVDDDGWKTCSNQSDCKASSFNNKVNISNLLGCKIWIQKKLRIHSANPSCASAVIPAIYQCDAEKLWLNYQKISFKQFLFFARNVNGCFLKRNMIYSDAGSEVPFEEIVANLPNLKRINFEYAPESKNVASDTVKNLLQIPHFKNIKHFVLRNISETFDIDAFYNYYKKTETPMDFTLDFGDDLLLSEDYGRKLERYINDILEFSHDRRPPTILFPGQNFLCLILFVKLRKQFPCV